ncbi:MAG: hypothetical protein U9N61_11075 [Euryarchaeota archaeon]|nr:hypothetical protein [Euryarchaeota archaeon]
MGRPSNANEPEYLEGSDIYLNKRPVRIDFYHGGDCCPNGGRFIVEFFDAETISLFDKESMTIWTPNKALNYSIGVIREIPEKYDGIISIGDVVLYDVSQVLQYKTLHFVLDHFIYGVIGRENICKAEEKDIKKPQPPLHLTNIIGQG